MGLGFAKTQPTGFATACSLPFKSNKHVQVHAISWVSFEVHLDQCFKSILNPKYFEANLDIQVAWKVLQGGVNQWQKCIFIWQANSWVALNPLTTYQPHIITSWDVKTLSLTRDLSQFYHVNWLAGVSYFVHSTQNIPKLPPALSPVGKCFSSTALWICGSICSTESASTGRAKICPPWAAACRHFPGRVAVTPSFWMIDAGGLSPKCYWWQKWGYPVEIYKTLFKMTKLSHLNCCLRDFSPSTLWYTCISMYKPSPSSATGLHPTAPSSCQIIKFSKLPQCFSRTLHTQNFPSCPGNATHSVLWRRRYPYKWYPSEPILPDEWLGI